MTWPSVRPGPKPLPRHQCVVDDCTKSCSYPKSGLCSIHYRLLQRTGSTARTRRERGTGNINNGYVVHCIDGKQIFEHVLIATKALGKPLPKGVEVHHVNENRSDNRPENLVICPDKAYHKLLHTRMAALSACGDASFRKCSYCKQYSALETVAHGNDKPRYYHNACRSAHRKSMEHAISGQSGYVREMRGEVEETEIS